MSSSGWHRKRRNTPAELARNTEYASAEYRAARRAVKVVVDAGQGRCWRCDRPIRPGSRWHLGHDDHDRSVLRGAECPSCNLGAAARKGARRRNSIRRGATQIRL